MARRHAREKLVTWTGVTRTCRLEQHGCQTFWPFLTQELQGRGGKGRGREGRGDGGGAPQLCLAKLFFVTGKIYYGKKQTSDSDVLKFHFKRKPKADPQQNVMQRVVRRPLQSGTRHFGSKRHAQVSLSGSPLLILDTFNRFCCEAANDVGEAFFLFSLFFSVTWN